MKGVRLVLDVARWEFHRYFKPRQQVVAVLMIVLAGFGIVGLLRLADGDDPVNVAVIGNDALPVVERATTLLHLTAHDAGEEPALRDRVRSGDLDGVLRIHEPDRAELFAASRGEWIQRLHAHLAEARQEVLLRRSGIQQETLAELLAPPALAVRTAREEDGDAPRGGRFALVATLSVMLFTVFLGMSYIFTSITGEKQIRVTEQIVSAISAQTWIDGKILGIAAVSLASVAATAVGVGILFVVLRLMDGEVPVPTIELADPGLVLVIIAFGLLGLFFWFAFLAAIAALIDDPNTSARSSFLFLPVAATGLAFLALGNPDSGLVRMLSLLPPTAPGAMPARMLLGAADGLEVALSIVLLAAGVALLRIAAGRVFRLGMLMYGKEPSWREVRRWIVR